MNTGPRKRGCGPLCWGPRTPEKSQHIKHPASSGSHFPKADATGTDDRRTAQRTLSPRRPENLSQRCPHSAWCVTSQRHPSTALLKTPLGEAHRIVWPRGGPVPPAPPRRLPAASPCSSRAHGRGQNSACGADPGPRARTSISAAAVFPCPFLAQNSVKPHLEMDTVI